MDCPNCRCILENESECHHCGIIVEKFLSKKNTESIDDLKKINEKHEGLFSFLARDKELLDFYLSQYQSLNAGFSAQESLRLFLDNKTALIGKNSYKILVKTTHTNNPMSQSMLSCSQFFPHYHALLVKSGEVRGRPDQAFHELHEIIRQKIKLKKNIAKKMVYPGFLIIASCIILPAPVLFSHGLLAYLTLCLAPLCLVVFACVSLYRSFQFLVRFPKINLMVDQLKFKIPVLKIFYLNEYIRVFISLFRAGLPVSEVYGHAAGTTGNLFFEKRAGRFESGIEEGQSFEIVFRAMDLFPEDFMAYLVTGEAAGRIDASLEKYLQFSEENFRDQVNFSAQMVASLVIFLSFALICVRIVTAYTNYPH